MQVHSMVQLGLKHACNTVAETLYLKTGIDRTKPITFHGLVNERCNARCRHCEYWRLPNYGEELSIAQWQSALMGIKAFVGAYAINFSGGEPLMKKGFIDLLAFCGHNGIQAGVTTNGALLTEKKVKKIVAARPFNVNISVDAPVAGIHDYFRGVPGLFDKVCTGIRRLAAEQHAQQTFFPVIVKPTITSLNYRLLPDLVRWAGEVGATAVNCQPLGRWTPETYDELWIEQPAWEELAQVMEQLIEMKKNGAPIMNSVENLRMATANFREEMADSRHMPCRIGLQEFYIRPNGDVCLCFHFPPVGNVARQNAREIWRGEAAGKIRRATTRCSRLCLATCHSHKSLMHKAAQALKLFKSGRRDTMPALGEST